jgi:hypothetical protein
LAYHSTISNLVYIKKDGGSHLHNSKGHYSKFRENIKKLGIVLTTTQKRVDWKNMLENTTEQVNPYMQLIDEAIRKSETLTAGRKKSSELLNEDQKAKSDLEKREEQKQRLKARADKMAMQRYGKSLDELKEHEYMPIIHDLSTWMASEKAKLPDELDFSLASTTAKTIARLKTEPRQQNDEKVQ